MPDQSGRRIAFGLGKETTRGTVAAPAYWVQHLSADFQNTNEKIYNESVLGVLDKYNASEVVKDWAEGKIEGKVTDKAFGLLLLALFGTDTAALHSGETAVWDHTFTETQTNTNQSLTVTRKDLNSDMRYALAMLKSLELTVVVGEFVKYSATFVSKKGATATDTVSYVVENEFKPKYATVKLASALAGLSGATAVPIRDFKITFNKELNPYFVFGSNDPAEIFNTQFDVTGDFTLRYTDTTYEALFYADTKQAMSLDIKNTDVTLGTATSPELLITMPKVALSDWKIDQKPGSMTEQTVGFQGLFDIANGYQCRAVLTNAVSSY